jgi:2,3-bisphosphoglycerate-independent phosphoglycerate mutase
MPSYLEQFGKTGAVISAVDLIKGLGRILGLEVMNVPGATAYYDTDYQAKANYGLRALHNKDFVFLHVEAPDEAGHNGDLREKITAIERFDKYVVGNFLKYFQRTKEKFRLLVLPDHATPLSVRTHTNVPVCFGLVGEGISHNGFEQLNEQKAKESSIKFASGVELIEYFFSAEGGPASGGE